MARKRRPRRLEHEALRRTAHKDGTYERLLEEQGGVCAICGKPPPETRRLDIDHDHSRMQIRQLLCRNCNLKLSYRLSPEWLVAAAEYLRKHSDG